MKQSRSNMSRAIARSLACAAIVAVIGGAVGVPGRAAPPSGFVTRSGQQLLLDGQSYRFTGINIYNANNASGCWYSLASGPDLGTSLDTIGGGAKVIRAWFFQALATRNGGTTRDWSGFDHTLQVAAAHHTKVVVTLGNQWPDCDGVDGGAGSYKNDAWYTSGYTQPDPAGTESYRDFVADVVARYKNDPTVLAWQLMNEAEVKPSSGSSDCSTNAEGILKEFATDVSGLIKSIDPNHLVSLGTLGSGQCGAQGAEYQDLHSVPTIDLCEYHDYGSPNVPMPGDQFNGLQKRLDQCNALGKPLFVGEMGIKPSEATNAGAPPVSNRADGFDRKFRAQFKAGVVGELVWAWNKDGSSDTDYDIGPGDPTLRMLTVWNAPSAGTLERESVTGDGTQGNAWSYFAHATSDGRYVLFSSGASNFAPGDTFGGCGSVDAFLKDTRTGSLELESVDSGGHRLGGYCGTYGDAISADGRYVLLESDAYRSTPTQYNGPDILVRDRVLGTTRNLTAGADGQSYNATMTPDGRYVLFQSYADNLAPGVPACPFYAREYLYDLQTNTVEVEDRDVNGDLSTCAGGNGAWVATMSADGRYVAFTTDEDLVPSDAGQFRDNDIYLRDRQTGTLTPISVDSDGMLVGGWNPKIALDGSAVAFESNASTIVPNDTNGDQGLYGEDVFVYDVASSSIERVSLDGSGHEFEGVNQPSISGHGRFVAFVAGHSGGEGRTSLMDVYVHDRQTGSTERIVGTDGLPENNPAELPELSPDAHYIVFDSYASDLVSGDTNGDRDVFLHTRSGARDGTAASAPGAPSGVVAAAGDASAAVSWVAPANDGGSQVTSYAVTPHDTTAGTDGTAVTVTGTSASITGLVNSHAYTFTVVASNDVGPSAPSAPSTAVTPQAGSPPPVAVVATVSPAAPTSVSTGSDPAQTGGATTAVTVPSGTSGGTVSLAQSATAESPPTGSGYQFGGVQVDISAPAATAANPLVLVFTFAVPSGQPADQTSLDSTRIYRAEGTGTPVAVADCTGSGASPDPCVASRAYVAIGGATYAQLTVRTSTASHWNTATPAPLRVSVTDGAYTPASGSLSLAAGSVEWTFVGRKQHTVTERDGLGSRGTPLFDSGAKTAGRFTYRLFAAGTYSYRSTVKGDSLSGTVGVPVRVTPATGRTSTSFTVVWARQPPSGYAYDIQLRFRPAGSKNWKSWANWRTSTTLTSATLAPPYGAGTYGLQARLRNATSGKTSGWSPETLVDVS